MEKKLQIAISKPISTSTKDISLIINHKKLSSLYTKDAQFSFVCNDQKFQDLDLASLRMGRQTSEINSNDSYTQCVTESTQTTQRERNEAHRYLHNVRRIQDKYTVLSIESYIGALCFSFVASFGPFP